MTCTCGLAADFDACCGPRLAGERQAATAEELMRTRYSAYVKGDVDFLYHSQAPEGRADFDRDAAEQWSRQAEWQGLEVLRTEAGGADDTEGVVEFVARYRIGDEDITHHEIATFRRGEGRWLFVDGQPPRQEPYRRPTRKVGPNEPCPCGSGKKHKKCCGARR